MYATPPRKNATWLFWPVSCLAVLLLALVLIAPALEDGLESAEEGDVWPRLIALFARDEAVRRTALASGAGLFVSAWVFFLPRRRPTRGHRRQIPPPRPRSDRTLGA